MSTAQLSFTVTGRIGRPVHEVYEMVADPERLSGFFTTGGAVGRLETGSVVQWDFADFPGTFPVHVLETVQDRRIVLRWEAAADSADGTPELPDTTEVTLTFEPLDGDTRTLVSITETGWRDTPAGREASYDNCGGWSSMLSALKAKVEYGITLRTGLHA